jgi:hypothetical protein
MRVLLAGLVRTRTIADQPGSEYRTGCGSLNGAVPKILPFRVSDEERHEPGEFPDGPNADQTAADIFRPV